MFEPTDVLTHQPSTTHTLSSTSVPTPCYQGSWGTVRGRVYSLDLWEDPRFLSSGTVPSLVPGLSDSTHVLVRTRFRGLRTDVRKGKRSRSWVWTRVPAPSLPPVPSDSYGGRSDRTGQSKPDPPRTEESGSCTVVTGEIDQFIRSPGALSSLLVSTRPE